MSASDVSESDDSESDSDEIMDKPCNPEPGEMPVRAERLKKVLRDDEELCNVPTVDTKTYIIG